MYACWDTYAIYIPGHGSFAIENARHALECGAASVVLLARHDVVVMSRTAGLFVDRNVDKVKMPTTIVLKALWNAHKLIGRLTLTCALFSLSPFQGRNVDVLSHVLVKRVLIVCGLQTSVHTTHSSQQCSS